MLKKIALICALMAMVSLPAFAEVQNVKVSGDITAMGVYRNNYDLEGKFWSDALGWQNMEDQDSFLMSIARLRVDADLTDNVATCLRIANLRDWDTDAASNSDLILDLANVTLKEMLYSPLTVVIGRQELMYGNGMVVGYGLYQDPNNSIAYNDLSSLHGYDAVRAILDYDPLTVDLVIAKMFEADDAAGTNARNSDTDLYGINLNYKLENDAVLEGYLFVKNDQNYALTMYDSNNVISSTNYSENKVYTVGLRGSTVYNENLALNGEIAGQFGEINETGVSASEDVKSRDRQAMMADVSASYKLADVKFVPTLGVGYVYLSGEEIGDNEGLDDSDFNAWDSMYRGKTTGSIRDCLETLYTTNDATDTSGWTNQHTVKATCGLDLGDLVNGLSMDLAYMHYWFDEKPSYTNDENNIGDELNMKLVYDYTEDVQFALNGALFLPGKYYNDASSSRVYQGGGQNVGGDAVTNREANEIAASLIGSCKVSF